MIETIDLIIIVFGLICFTHSAVLSLVILSLSNEKHDSSKNWLSVLLLVLSIRIGKSISHLYLGDVFPDFAIYLSYGINFLGGPILYAYFCALKKENLKNVKWHFIPGTFLIILSPFLPISWWFVVYIMLIVQTLAYLYFSFRKIDSFFSFDNVLSGWQTVLFLSVSGVSLSYFLVVLFDWNQYLLPIITYAILVYIMTLYLIKGNDIKKLISLQEKYRYSKLSQSQRTAIMNKLNQLLNEQKLYKEADLNLKKISNLIGIQESYISQTISTELNINFNELINNKRIEDLCRDLKRDKNGLMNIEQHAYSNGFSSMSAFYSIFKKSKGVTPTQFRKGAH